MQMNCKFENDGSDLPREFVNNGKKFFKKKIIRGYCSALIRISHFNLRKVTPMTIFGVLH